MIIKEFIKLLEKLPQNEEVLIGFGSHAFLYLTNGYETKEVCDIEGKKNVHILYAVAREFFSKPFYKIIKEAVPCKHCHVNADIKHFEGRDEWDFYCHICTRGFYCNSLLDGIEEWNNRNKLIPVINTVMEK